MYVEREIAKDPLKYKLLITTANLSFLDVCWGPDYVSGKLVIFELIFDE